MCVSRVLYVSAPMAVSSSSLAAGACVIFFARCRCMWLLLEPLMKDQASFYTFQKKIFEYIKQTKDAQDPDNDVANRKMWAVCDLGIQIIMQRLAVTSSPLFLHPSTPLLLHPSTPPLLHPSSTTLPNTPQTLQYSPFSLEITPLNVVLLCQSNPGDLSPSPSSH